ncbi:MAG: hypothetical protein WCP73_04805 [Eubacteriales bacterium]
MVANIFPNLLNFTNVSLYDLIQMVVIIILAIAAITVGVIAGRLNEQTVESNQKIAELAQQTAQQSKMMKQTEMNIAFSKQIIEIYNFFVKDIFINNFFNKDNEDLLREKCNEILSQSSFLFNMEIYEVIEKSVHKIMDAHTEGIRAYTEEEYAKAKNNPNAGIEIKIYEAFMNRENNAEDTIRSYESMLKRTVFLSNIRDDIAGAFSYFKLNLGPERMESR